MSHGSVDPGFRGECRLRHRLNHGATGCGRRKRQPLHVFRNGKTNHVRPASSGEYSALALLIPGSPADK